MRKIFTLSCLLGFLVSFSVEAAERDIPSVIAPASPTWKGPLPSTVFQLGVSAGMGFVVDDVGGTLQGRASFRIVEEGFIPDVSDQVFLEGLFGYMRIPNFNSLQYGVHLRWDFHATPDWTVFAIGGLGGSIVLYNARNTLWILRPRFGIGVFYHLIRNARLRADLASDFITLGVDFAI